jgi:outer membrane murein-binding lipoprotein Lpp
MTTNVFGTNNLTVTNLTVNRNASFKNVSTFADVIITGSINQYLSFVSSQTAPNNINIYAYKFINSIAETGEGNIVKWASQTKFAATSTSPINFFQIQPTDSSLNAAGTNPAPYTTYAPGMILHSGIGQYTNEYYQTVTCSNVYDHLYNYLNMTVRVCQPLDWDGDNYLGSQNVGIMITSPYLTTSADPSINNNIAISHPTIQIGDNIYDSSFNSTYRHSNVQIWGNQCVVDVNSSIFNGPVVINNGVTINEGVIISGGTTYTGSVIFDSGITVYNGATINGTTLFNSGFNVYNLATFNGNAKMDGTCTVDGLFTASGAATVAGELTVLGLLNAAVTTAEELTVAGDTNLLGLVTMTAGGFIVNGGDVTMTSGLITLTAAEILMFGNVTLTGTVTIIGPFIPTAVLDVSSSPGFITDGGITANVTTSQLGQLPTVITNVGTLQSDVGTLNSTVSTLSSTVSGLQTDVGTLDTTVSGLQSDVTTLSSTVSTLDSTVTGLQSDVSTLSSTVSTLNSTVSGLQTDVGTLDSNVSTLQSDVGTLNSTVSGLQSDVTTLSSTVSGLQTDVGTLNSTVSTLDSNVTTLQSDVALLETYITVSATTPNVAISGSFTTSTSQSNAEFDDSKVLIQKINGGSTSYLQLGGSGGISGSTWQLGQYTGSYSSPTQGPYISSDGTNVFISAPNVIQITPVGGGTVITGGATGIYLDPLSTSQKVNINYKLCPAILNLRGDSIYPFTQVISNISTMSSRQIDLWTVANSSNISYSGNPSTWACYGTSSDSVDGGVAFGISAKSSTSTSVALGKNAFATYSNSIVINASATALTSTNSGFFVNPVNNLTSVVPTNFLVLTTNNEIVRNNYQQVSMVTLTSGSGSVEVFRVLETEGWKKHIFYLTALNGVATYTWVVNYTRPLCYHITPPVAGVTITSNGGAGTITFTTVVAQTVTVNVEGM